MEKKFRIKKIPIHTLLETLRELEFLWEEGLEYVDIEATISPEKDRIAFVPIDGIISSFFFSIDEYEQIIYLGP